jgi:hypothetical protein
MVIGKSNNLPTYLYCLKEFLKELLIIVLNSMLEMCRGWWFQQSYVKRGALPRNFFYMGYTFYIKNFIIFVPLSKITKNVLNCRIMEIKRTRKGSKWNDDFKRMIRSLALLQATDEQMADVIGVNINTFNYWKRTHPDFLAAMNSGKMAADAKVAESLFKRANGFYKWETHVCMYKGEVIQTPVRKYYPPDSWAAARILSIRQRTKWTDVTKTETIQTSININKIDFTNLSTEELLLMKQIQEKQKHLAISEHGISKN